MIEKIKKLYHKLSELSGKKNYGYFVSGLLLLGMLMQANYYFFLGGMVTLVADVGLLIYAIRLQCPPLVILFFGAIMILLCQSEKILNWY